MGFEVGFRVEAKLGGKLQPPGSRTLHRMSSVVVMV